MKNNLFWKVCAVVFLVLVAVWVWSQSIVINQFEGYVYKVNRLTGKTQVLSIGNMMDEKDFRVF